MKVVLINTSERTGGAAVAANRLVKALRKSGVEATMLVRDRSTDDSYTVSVSKTSRQRFAFRFRFLWERLVIFLQNGFSRKRLFEVSIANTGVNLRDHPLVKEADVIHLHWINQGFLSIRDIRKLQQTGKPLVWTMHDMWPCTGICHHARECTHYYNFCHHCPRLHSRWKHDLSARTYKKKAYYLCTKDIAYVPCSQWLEGQTRKSALIQGSITHIPNPIDTSVFKRQEQEKHAIRVRLGLPLDKRLVLFGALNVNDQRKGIGYLVKAIPKVKSGIALVVFGQVKTEIASFFSLPIYSLGYLTDEQDIRDVYAAVDCFATPSLEENLPNMIMEAMACGTPCVGFNVGGIPEMIEHQQNGYVAKYRNSTDFARGIDWVLAHNSVGELSDACVEKVEANYSEKVVATRYIELYNQLLSV